MSNTNDRYDPLETDSSEYDILVDGVCAVADVNGIIAEIGVRRGGSLDIMIQADKAMVYQGADRVYLGIDPYGDIQYRSQEFIEERLDYTNVMRNETVSALNTKYRHKNVIILPISDTEYFKSFKDGLPTYNNITDVINKYALVHYDGPHSVNDIKRQVDFFDSRTPIGGVWVFDDVDYYPHDTQLHPLIISLGFEVLRKGDKKISYKRVDNNLRHYVINLARRHDRWHQFIKDNNDHNVDHFECHNAYDGTAFNHVHTTEQLGFHPLEGWKDPMLHRSLTSGEVGCFISHYQLWEKCVELNRPIVIFEDDVYPTPYEYYHDELKVALYTYDLVYLSRLAMDDKDTVIDDTFTKPGYSYWACAYAITPEGARKLLAPSIKNNVIPVDEYIPIMTGATPPEPWSTSPPTKWQFEHINSVINKCIKLNAASFTINRFQPHKREIMGSDTENTGMNVTNNDLTKPIVVTVASDVSKAQNLINSCNVNDIDLKVLGRDMVWNGGNMSGPGGGQKINLMREYLQSLYPDDIVLFVDGYDVVINDNLETIVERFLGFNCDVVFAAEKICWPNMSMANRFPTSHTEYRYLNSGCYIGYVKSLLELMSETIDDSDDDQLYLQNAYLKRWEGIPEPKVQLDVENYIFQCMNDSYEDVKLLPNGQLNNSATNCCPCILHGNGVDFSMSAYLDIVHTLGYNVKRSKFTTVSKEIVMMENVFTPEKCAKIIADAEAYGNWGTMYGDSVPGQELRIREFDMGLFVEIEKLFLEQINPFVENYWSPLVMHGIRDAFIIKYSTDGQNSLPLHNDSSLITLSVKLNEDYIGGELSFPRQQYTNSSLRTGSGVIWPSQVTHGHECLPIQSGVKYGLTIWTSRFSGDINY